MFKRIATVALLTAIGFLASAEKSHAGILLGRVAPVRRVAAHAVLPPYPITRRVIAAPIYRPVVGPVIGAPAIYGGPLLYGPSISVGIGF